MTLFSKRKDRPQTRAITFYTYPKLLFGWPLSARLHLILWRRALLSWRTWRRWFRLRDGSIPWKELQAGQHDLAVRLDDIGRSLVLPGDPDWKPPPTGVDDHEMVRRRTTS